MLKAMTSVMRDFTARYSPVESFLYDRLVAPAVASVGQELRSELVQLLGGKGHLLEVGSGGGQLARALVDDQPGLSMTCLDLSREQLRRARKRLRDVGSRVRFLHGSALALPFPDASFDAVVSVASIKHWPDQRRGLAECVRVLRPEGWVAIVEADRGCHLDDALGFVERWNIPSPLVPMALAFFRTYVAGRSIDLEDARELLSGLELASWEARRVAGQPALLMLGQRR